MIRSAHVACLVLLAGLGCGWFLPAWGADKSPAEAPAAAETKPAAPPADATGKPTATLARRGLRAVLGAGRHVGPGRAELRQRHQPSRTGRGGNPGRTLQARSLFKLHQPRRLDQVPHQRRKPIRRHRYSNPHRRGKLADCHAAGRYASLPSRFASGRSHPRDQRPINRRHLDRQGRRTT